MKINFLAALPFLMMAAIPLAPSPVSAAAIPAARAKSLPPEIQAGLDGGGSGFLSLDWKEPVVTQSEWANPELTLRFSRPLADAPIAEAGSRLGNAVETLRYGYDSVLLRLSPGFEPRVETTGTGVVVTFGRSTAEPGRSADQSRLNFIRAKALLASGEVASARAELQRFVADVLVPPDIARAARAARIDGSSGNRWRSFSTFDRMLRADPGNPVLLAHYATVLIDNGKLRLARNVLDY
jgi:hypothetical protein